MKKIALIILTMITIPSYATTMCAINDTVAVVLDPSVAGSASAVDNSTGVWTFFSPYGTMQGLAACINKSDDSYNHVLKDDRNNDGILTKVIGNERYGQYCWLKIMHPVSSRWVLARNYGSQGGCNSLCFGTSDWFALGGLFNRNENSLKSKLFGSISN